MMKKLPVLLAVFLFFSLSSIPKALSQGDPGYLVIVNQSNPVISLSKKQVSNMLLRQITKWEDGKRVEPADLPEKSGVRKDFTKDVHGRSISSINSYWEKQVKGGLNLPTPTFDTDMDVIEYVKSRPGAIGYVSSAVNLPDEVKSITLKN